MALLGVVPEVRSETTPSRWCAPEVEELSEGVCYAPAPAQTVAVADAGASDPEESEAVGPEGSAAGRQRPKCLIVFLHSLIRDETTWQWEQHRMLARAAKTLGVSVVMPRGRLAIGPGRSRNVWAWPTSPAMQTEHEEAIVEQWAELRRTLEQREGAFDKVFVFGFSNGAYYAASLAMRGRLDVQGYGVFAGGSGGKYQRIMGQRATVRAPVFVGWGSKDPAHGDQEALVRLLSDLHWPCRSQSARVGHMVTDSQLASAVHFLKGS